MSCAYSPYSAHFVLQNILCIGRYCPVCTCRAHRHRWWLKVSGKSRDVALPPSSHVEQAEGSVQMEGEVEFRNDPNSKPIKAVNGTEWMYRGGSLTTARQVCQCALYN